MEGRGVLSSSGLVTFGALVTDTPVAANTVVCFFKLLLTTLVCRLANLVRREQNRKKVVDA